MTMQIASALTTILERPTAIIAFRADDFPTDLLEGYDSDVKERVLGVLEKHGLRAECIEITSRDPFADVLDYKLCRPNDITIRSPKYAVIRFVPSDETSQVFDARVEACVNDLLSDLHGQSLGMVRSHAVELEECSFLDGENEASYRGLIRRKPRRFK